METSNVFLMSKDEIQIVLRIDGVVNVCVSRQHQFLVGEDLRQSQLVRVAFQPQLHHCIPNHLRRSLIVRQHYALIQHNSVQFNAVRLTCDSDYVKVGHDVAVGFEQRGVGLQLSIDVWRKLVVVGRLRGRF